LELNAQDLSIQNAAVSRLQQQELHEEQDVDNLTYWKEQLASTSSVLALPTDRLRSSIQTYQNDRQNFALSRCLSKALKAISQQEGVTLFMTLLAAFQTLLFRYSGQDDICVGSRIISHRRTEIEESSGFFVNTLLLRTDLSGNPTFRELLGYVRKITLEAYAHRDLPFEKLVEELHWEHNLSHSPLCQVMFILQDASAPSMELPDMAISAAEIFDGLAKFDLLLYVAGGREEITGYLEYDTGLFDAVTITKMLGHLQTLLAGIVTDPNQQISALLLLNEVERHQLLVEWNATSADYPRNTCIHQIFEAQVERTPDAIAVLYEGTKLTYRELNQRANQLAHHLQRLGVGPEVLVALCIERSLQMVVGLLGILKAGGAYVPLDPAYPKERLSFMLEDTQIPILASQEGLRESLPKCGMKVVYLDTDWEAIARESVSNPSSEVTAGNLVYVIYTSGSTGKPKGILVTHQNLVHSTCARMTYYRNPVKGFLLLSSFAFDSSVAGIFWTLCQGGMLVLPQQDLEQDSSRVAGVIADNHISHVLSIPSLYSLLLAQAKTQQLESLQVVIVAGESCPRELPDRHHSLLPRTALFNEYGPTEGTVWSSVYEFRFQGLGTTVTIGRPIANTQIYLLDRYLQPVPIGVPGELYIGGAGLARGYLNRPDLTEEKFIPHPFSSEPGARLYKTGDLARYLPDGNIEFLGRLDHQVKLRGYRIELGEIEAVLSQHPAVQEVVVMPREDVPDDKRLVAYVVPQREQNPTSSELRRLVQKRLPDYMVPSAFVLLEALPLNANGKIDRRSLPAPERVRTELDENYAAPILPIHQQLTQIWEELLDVRPIGIRDNFFDLGGHSLLAARLVSRIEQDWGKKIPLDILLDDATIERLAIVIEQPVEAAFVNSLQAFSTEVKVQSSRSNKGFFERIAGVMHRRASRASTSE